MNAIIIDFHGHDWNGVCAMLSPAVIGDAPCVVKRSGLAAIATEDGEADVRAAVYAIPSVQRLGLSPDVRCVGGVDVGSHREMCAALDALMA